MQKVVSVIAVLAITMAAAPSPSPSPSPRPAATHKKPAVVHKKAAVVHKRRRQPPRRWLSPTSQDVSQFPVIVTVLSKPFCNALRTTIRPSGRRPDPRRTRSSRPATAVRRLPEGTKPTGFSSGGRADMALSGWGKITVTPLVQAWPTSIRSSTTRRCSAIRRTRRREAPVGLAR